MEDDQNGRRPKLQFFVNPNLTQSNGNKVDLSSSPAFNTTLVGIFILCYRTHRMKAAIILMIAIMSVLSGE